MNCHCCDKNEHVHCCHICSKSMCNSCQIIKEYNQDHPGFGNDKGTCKKCFEPWVFWLKYLGKNDRGIFEMQHPRKKSDEMRRLYDSSLNYFSVCGIARDDEMCDNLAQPKQLDVHAILSEMIQERD